MLARELKLSCTNVMLQCLDADSRCAYVLGTMFKVDSSTAADVLGITPEAYRSACRAPARRSPSFWARTASTAARRRARASGA